MTKKLTKNASFFILGCMFLMIVIIGFVFQPEEITNEDNESETITLVKENVALKSEYIDIISKEQSSNKYVPCKILISKDEMILGNTITQNQSFVKYKQLLGPKDEYIIKNSKHKVTHNDYSCLLTGDIIKKAKNNKISYVIDNARVTCDVIPVVLLKGNNVMIGNKDKTKTKTYQAQDFFDKLNDVKKRKEILNW